MERSVNKLTSKTIKPLKPKHVQILTGASWQREVPISELFRFINHRLREDHWVVVFKALITIHILMREGATDRVIGFVASNAGLLNMANFRDRTNTALGHEQAKNLRAYALYLEEKVMTYREIKTDFVRTKPDMIARLRSLAVEDGLLKEVELLQRQINALLSCTFYLEEIDNVVTLQAFRLLIGDMMALFHLLNESVIRILGEYFEMSKADATRALQIYKNFATQTTKTVEFFEIARRLKHALGIDVPVFKHAPVSLAGALEDYLKAPDFEAQRRAYKQKKANKGGSSVPEEDVKQSTKKPEATAPKKQEEPSIDFFSSLDNELSAFNAPAVQAQYNANADPFGSLWVPDSVAGNASNPFGQPSMAQQGHNPFALETQELQKQTQDINSQLQLLQAGISSFNSNPTPQTNQLMLANQGFPPLQPQQSQFGNFVGAAALPQQSGGDAGFTVENVFGNTGGASTGNAFGGLSMGGTPAIGGGFAPTPAPLTSQSSSYDPFAGLGLTSTQQQPSQSNPTLDPFSTNRATTPLQQMSQTQHNPFAPSVASVSSSAFGGLQQQQQTSPYRPSQPASSSPFAMGTQMQQQQQPNYIATSNNTPFGAFGAANSTINRQQQQPFSGGVGGGMQTFHTNTSQPAFNPFAPVSQQPQQQSQPQQSAAAFNPFAPVQNTNAGFNAFQSAPGQQPIHDSSLI